MPKISILGCGTVGSGVLELIERKRPELEELARENIIIGKILRRHLCPGVPYSSSMTTDPEEFFRDNSRIIVEAIGGVEDAYRFVKRALEEGRHVVSANKDLFAAHGPELLRIAQAHNVRYLFGAAVGGEMPVISEILRLRKLTEIVGFDGILNGTTNYILTKMTIEGKTFDVALREAQEKGFAEADPSSDVDGVDAARKLAIVASLAFGRGFVDYRNIKCEGIRSITPIDIERAKSKNCVFKLMVSCRKTPSGILASVKPMLVPQLEYFGQINFEANAVTIHCAGGSTYSYRGFGAGKIPTATTVIRDIEEVIAGRDRPHPPVLLNDAPARLINTAEDKVSSRLRDPFKVSRPCIIS